MAVWSSLGQKCSRRQTTETCDHSSLPTQKRFTTGVNVANKVLECCSDCRQSVRRRFFGVENGLSVVKDWL